MDNNNCCVVVYHDNGLSEWGQEGCNRTLRLKSTFSIYTRLINCLSLWVGWRFCYENPNLASNFKQAQTLIVPFSLYCGLTCQTFLVLHKNPWTKMCGLYHCFYGYVWDGSMLIIYIAPLSFESHRSYHFTPSQNTRSIALSMFLFFFLKLQIHRCQLVWVMTRILSVDSLVSASC